MCHACGSVVAMPRLCFPAAASHQMTPCRMLQGSLPMPLAGLIIGRDVLLVGGAFVHRAREVRALGVEACAMHIHAPSDALCMHACARWDGAEWAGQSSSGWQRPCHRQQLSLRLPRRAL